MPSNVLANVYNMLISPDHKVIRGSIGISFNGSLPPAVAREYGFANGGVLVATVTPNGPAAKAGLQPGDVVVSIDGKPIKDGDAAGGGRLRHARSDRRCRWATCATASRTPRRSASPTAPSSMPMSAPRTTTNAAPAEVDAGEGKLGITVSAVPRLASKLGDQRRSHDQHVKPGSFADEINLTKGTIITEINKKPVTDEAAYRSIVSALKSGQDVVFAVRSPEADAPPGLNLVGGTLP